SNTTRTPNTTPNPEHNPEPRTTNSELFGYVRNKRELSRPRNGGLQRALVLRARARDAPRLDLAALRDERRQQAHVLVVDVIDLVRAELADAAPPEEPAAARTIALVLLLVVLLAAAAAASAPFPAHR